MWINVRCLIELLAEFCSIYVINIHHEIKYINKGEDYVKN